MKPKSISLEVDDEADHIFVSYFNTTGKEATNSPSQNKNKNITPKGISAEIFVARFWRLRGGHTSRALILYWRVRHQTAMATLARRTHPTAAKAACPCEKGHVFLTWQLTCAGQPPRCESLPAPILPAFPVLVPFRMGGTRSPQGEGRQCGQLPLSCPSAPLLPLCLPPGTGQLAKGAAESSGAGSAQAEQPSGIPGHSRCLFWQLRKARSILPALAAWGGGRGKGKEGEAGGCCLWEEGLTRVKGKGCWFLVAPHTLTDSF